MMRKRGMKMGRLNTIISIISLILLIVATAYAVWDHYSSRDIEITNKLDDLNSNVIKLLPSTPAITLEYFGETGFPGREISLFELSGYLKCSRNVLIPIEDKEVYERVLIFIENEGKKTTDLRVKIKCSPNSYIMATCVDSGSIIEEGVSDMESVIKIPKVDSISPHHVSLFYQSKGQPQSCTISYDSEDFPEKQEQIVNITFYPRDR